MRLKGNTIFLVVLSVSILHFIVTSIVGNYIVTQVGSLSGQVIAEGLIEATNKPNSTKKDANIIYQQMKDKSEKVFSKWKITLFLISLPAKPFLMPLHKSIRKVWIDDPVQFNKIDKDQIKKRAGIIDNGVNGLNSLFLGTLIYLVYSLIMKFRNRRKVSLIDKNRG